MPLTRRTFLQTASLAATANLIPAHALSMRADSSQPAAAPSAPQDMLAQMRQEAASAKIKSTKLTDTLFLLEGAGGNQIVQIGPDGKLLIDSSVSTAGPQIKEVIGKLDPHPLRLLINTHWHFDHTDGNAAMHDAGAFIIAHTNTRKRLSTPQNIVAYNLKLAPSPVAALPQQVFDQSQSLYFNNDELSLVHVPPAHTDTDIYISLKNGNVLHTGDLWFNGFYPFIDASSGGRMHGMVDGVDNILAIVDEKTKIVPGHGPLGDKAALQKYRDMLTAVALKVEKLKTSGMTLEQVVAAKPTADYDAVWGKGFLQPDTFAAVAYSTLP